jgi:hypothetical protein
MHEFGQYPLFSAVLLWRDEKHRRGEREEKDHNNVHFVVVRCLFWCIMRELYL